MSKKNNYLVTEDWRKFDGNLISVVSYPNLSKSDIESLKAFFDRFLKKNKVFRDITVPKRFIRTIRWLLLGKKYKIFFLEDWVYEFYRLKELFFVKGSVFLLYEHSVQKFFTLLKNSTYLRINKFFRNIHSI